MTGIVVHSNSHFDIVCNVTLTLKVYFFLLVFLEGSTGAIQENGVLMAVHGASMPSDKAEVSLLDFLTNSLGSKGIFLARPVVFRTAPSIN